MEDILGRELKVNDLVLGMVISRDSDGIRFGVFNGESVHWAKWNVTSITTSVMSNVYLIENPSEKELEIKQKIIAKVEEYKREQEEAKNKRKALKRIPTKDLTIGETYVDDRGYTYVYLGIGSVHDSYTNETKQGYIYLSTYSAKYNVDTDTFNWLPSVDVVKNPRKLVSVSEEKLMSDYVFDKKEFVLKDNSSNYYGRYGRTQKLLKFKLGE